ncbi:MAG: UDP-N-acetylmuramoyl-tripeptide--D-alanyl-D-alanine ligase [Desulfobacteraceae bacterium]|nr:UDP-N-acetylmuramoyl-tripeptide--D-alanyl-D-alanine ligase [Desulfobacteraceae bacterium]
MTQHWTAAQLAGAAGGAILSGNPDTRIGVISTDTRKIAPGDCFIALAGENHDGHAFVADALKKGAGAAIVSEWNGAPPETQSAVIRVRDTLIALGAIARFHRSRFDIPVVAVSGSNGKTSTKEMVAAIFSRSRKVLKNKGNFNNLVGLPLTLLDLTEDHELAVVEMGINVPGEMERLARIGRPTVGIITNVHPAHLEGLQTVDRILEEKGKLWRALGPDGLAVVNMDDPMLARFAQTLDTRRITYSVEDPSADVGIASQILVSEGQTRFSIRFRGSEIPVALPAMGIHHARNALAAAAAALGTGASTEDVRTGLAAYEPVNQRMQCIRLRNGSVVVDDTYNANPGSLLAAVEAVLTASGGHPFVAVLGEMRELGAESGALHFEVGRKIGAAKPSRLVALGQLGREFLKGAQAAGMDASLCFHARDHEEAVAHLRANLPERAWILVKGSRAMAMEQVVEGLTGECLS